MKNAFKILLGLAFLAAITIGLTSASIGKKIQYPFGEADFVTTTDTAITVDNSLEYVDYDTITANKTITVEVSGKPYLGSLLYVRAVSATTGAYYIVPGTGFVGDTLEPSDTEMTFIGTFIYDGTNFVHVSTLQYD